MELGEVGGEGRVLEPAVGEPGVEAAERPGVRPAGVRGEGGLGEASGGRRRALEGGRGGTGRGEGIHLHHRRRSIHVSPASETRTSKRLRPGASWRSGVIQTMRASTTRRPQSPGRFLRHPADGLPGDPEPDLAAVAVELGPEPEGPVRFRGGDARRQGPRPAGPVLAPPLDDDRQLADGHVPAGKLFTTRSIIVTNSRAEKSGPVHPRLALALGRDQRNPAGALPPGTMTARPTGMAVFPDRAAWISCAPEPPGATGSPRPVRLGSVRHRRRRAGRVAAGLVDEIERV